MQETQEMQDTKFNPWVGKIPWRRKCNPLQYSCLENPTDRGAWRTRVHGVAESQTHLSIYSIYTYTYVCGYMYVCVYVCVCIYVCAAVCVYTHTYIKHYLLLIWNSSLIEHFIFSICWIWQFSTVKESQRWSWNSHGGLTASRAQVFSPCFTLVSVPRWTCRDYIKTLLGRGPVSQAEFIEVQMERLYYIFWKDPHLQTNVGIKN